MTSILHIIGLTGGIASGKSTIAGWFAECGMAVFDADRFVHHSLASGTLAAMVQVAFPSAVKNGVVDRKALGALVFADETKLKTLEAILHPWVRHAEQEFIEAQRSAGATACVLEIPLLFETGADTLCTHTLTAQAPLEQRIARAMQRPNMTEAKIEAILARQWSDEQRAARAHHVIDTGRSLDHTYAQCDAVLERLAVL